MFRKTRLYTPGPTPLLPAAQFAMAAADIHHRTAEFRALYTKVLAQLKEFVGTKNDVLLLSCSGTGAMEASVSNLTSPGDRVLVLSAGKFGERWDRRWPRPSAAGRSGQRSLRRNLRSGSGQGRAQAGHQGRLRPGHRNLDRRPPLTFRPSPSCSKRQESPPSSSSTASPASAPPTSTWTLGNRRPHRRLAEGGHDSARTRLSLRQRQGLGRHGNQQEPALLLRPAQGAQVRQAGRKRLHALRRPHRRPGRGARLHRRAGRAETSPKAASRSSKTRKPAPP
jgi:hypothetical protein